jgi:predicted enzyme involved in methoxymalonyl-ACP biosynthesis
VCEIDTFLMSCRVIGRTVETALLAKIAEHARQHGAAQLQGRFIPTKKNAPAAEFYREHGFEEAGDGVWKLDLSKASVPLPEWITVV